MKVPHLITLADLSPAQINRFLVHSHNLKRTCLPLLRPFGADSKGEKRHPQSPKTLADKSVALVFSKRSTRTRLAAETSVNLLGGNALFLAPSDIQLGVNETLRDSARVIGGMCQGIFARVGKNEEIEELAKYSPVPVLNALSDLWHPTQILADLLTLHEHAHLFTSSSPSSDASLPPLPPLTLTWLGDSTNVLHDILVAFPRLNPLNRVRVAVPPKAEYQCPKPVWDRVKQLGIEKQIHWCSDPREAVHGANVVVTDTWISMGLEDTKAQRLADFSGYQVTEKLCAEGGAKKDWAFLHCLPRKSDEVDDEVFYGPRSLVFPEADNRKWTIMALFETMIGRWNLLEEEAMLPK